MGTLYLVPTPVGNLDDITFRALKVLKEADLILAEDTRTSGILLKHFDIKKPMLSYHKFNEHQTVDRVVERLKGGETVAVVSDAGQSYAFTATHNKGVWTFHPVAINKGREDNGFVEIIAPSQTQTNTQYALSGAYYILSEMKKSETGEED